jgi:hypothetical protein
VRLSGELDLPSFKKLVRSDALLDQFFRQKQQQQQELQPENAAAVAAGGGRQAASAAGRSGRRKSLAELEGDASGLPGSAGGGGTGGPQSKRTGRRKSTSGTEDEFAIRTNSGTGSGGGPGAGSNEAQPASPVAVSSVAAVPPPMPAGFQRRPSAATAASTSEPGAPATSAPMSREQVKASSEEVKRVMSSLQVTMDHLMNMRQQLTGLSAIFDDALSQQEQLV